jgi:hypothetical protein
LDTPVVFLIFNRPDVTSRVFDAIRRVRPTKLLVVADGPRTSRPGEDQLCASARRIIESIDWRCELLRNYSDQNMGCGRRVSSGLTWAFEQVESAIILEDDCAPSSSFFAFCAELLDRYHDDPRVMSITGNNFQHGIKRGRASYYFSRFPHIWGWATWRRSWQGYDFSLSEWAALRETDWLKSFAQNLMMEAFWRNGFDSVAEGRLDTWDYQWVFHFWKNNGLTATPNANLVTNIGFRSDATHTTLSDELMVIPSENLKLPLKHPKKVRIDADADQHVARHIFLRQPLREPDNGLFASIRTRARRFVDYASSKIPIRSKF